MFFRLDWGFSGFGIDLEIKTGLILLEVVGQGKHGTGLLKVMGGLGRWGQLILNAFGNVYSVCGWVEWWVKAHWNLFEGD